MPDDSPQKRFETLAVHAGHLADAGQARPSAVPIHPAASFYYDNTTLLEQQFDTGYVYSRFSNPTVSALEAAVATLESAEEAVAFGSGMAALHAAVVGLLGDPDGLVLASRDSYGGTQGLLAGPLADLGVRSLFVDLTHPAGVEQGLSERPRLVLLETISNPLLRVVDLASLAGRAHELGARVIVDSTFSTPFLCRPLGLGADLVVHSATKYLGGHGDVTAGVVAGSAELIAEVRRVARLVGGVLGPQEAWLTLRGLRTLALRMERQCRNAAALAIWLEQQPRVSRVHYPGLASHPQHEVAARVLHGGFGAMVSFDLEPPNRASAERFIDHLRLFKPAPTLGDVQSLVMYPRRAAQRGMSPEDCTLLGIGPGLIRLSIGIEALEDLEADLARALAA